MRYTDYRDIIQKELKKTPTGLTWPQLQQRLNLPYTRPCPAWTKQLESEINLTRTKSTGRSLIWKIGHRGG